MAAFRIHTGLQPGELLLHSLQAQSPGVIVVPAASHPTRFSVDQIAGPLFCLARVSTPAWPTPPEREALFVFERRDDATAALKALEEALMHEVEPSPPTHLPPPRLPLPVLLAAWGMAAASLLACAALLKTLF